MILETAASALHIHFSLSFFIIIHGHNMLDKQVSDYLSSVSTALNNLSEGTEAQDTEDDHSLYQPSQETSIITLPHWPCGNDVAQLNVEDNEVFSSGIVGGIARQAYYISQSDETQECQRQMLSGMISIANKVLSSKQHQLRTGSNGTKTIVFELQDDSENEADLTSAPGHSIRSFHCPWYERRERREAGLLPRSELWMNVSKLLGRGSMEDDNSHKEMQEQSQRWIYEQEKAQLRRSEKELEDFEV